MKHFRRGAALLLVLCMLAALAACGQKTETTPAAEPEPASEPAPVETQVPEEPAAPAEPETPEEPEEPEDSYYPVTITTYDYEGN